jgi:hypothetical protein
MLDVLDSEKSSKKFENVGLLAKKRGGYRNSSSRGLNACENMKMIGNVINAAIGVRIR